MDACVTGEEQLCQRKHLVSSVLLKQTQEPCGVPILFTASAVLEKATHNPHGQYSAVTFCQAQRTQTVSFCLVSHNRSSSSQMTCYCLLDVLGLLSLSGKTNLTYRFTRLENRR